MKGHYFTNFHMFLEMLIIWLPPKYKYFKFIKSKSCSGNIRSRFPLKFNSLNDVQFVKLFGNDSLLSKLFFATKVLIGQYLNKSGNTSNPLLLTSSTLILENFFTLSGTQFNRLWCKMMCSISRNVFFASTVYSSNFSQLYPNPTTNRHNQWLYPRFHCCPMYSFPCFFVNN